MKEKGYISVFNNNGIKITNSGEKNSSHQKIQMNKLNLFFKNRKWNYSYEALINYVYFN